MISLAQTNVQKTSYKAHALAAIAIVCLTALVVKTSNLNAATPTLEARSRQGAGMASPTLVPTRRPSQKANAALRPPPM